MLREVQLDPAFARLYPALSPGRWYTAAAAVGLLRGVRILRDGRRYNSMNASCTPPISPSGEAARGRAVGSAWARVASIGRPDRVARIIGMRLSTRAVALLAAGRRARP